MEKKTNYTSKQKLQRLTTAAVLTALSLVLMVLILICMAVMNRFSGDEEGMVI